MTKALFFRIREYKQKIIFSGSDIFSAMSGFLASIEFPFKSLL